MNNQPYAVSFGDAKITDFVNAAKKSGRKEAETRKRTQQILDYYKGNRSGKNKK